MTAYNDDNQGITEKFSSQANFRTNSHANVIDSTNGSSPSLIEKFVIRLPKGLRSKIKHLSEKNRRSMNSEIIMVLEKHIQQNLSDEDAAEFLNEAISQTQQKAAAISSGIQRPSDSELSRRLENLSVEKKQALLELLG